MASKPIKRAEEIAVCFNELLAYATSIRNGDLDENFEGTIKGNSEKLCKQALKHFNMSPIFCEFLLSCFDAVEKRIDSAMNDEEVEISQKDTYFLFKSIDKIELVRAAIFTLGYNIPEEYDSLYQQLRDKVLENIDLFNFGICMEQYIKKNYKRFAKHMNSFVFSTVTKFQKALDEEMYGFDMPTGKDPLLNAYFEKLNKEEKINA